MKRIPTRQALLQASQALTSSGSPELDSQILLAEVLGHERSWLFAHPEEILTASQTNDFFNLIERRAGGMPVAYLTGHQEFWSLRFQVTPETLIPRPETELLVETALALWPGDECSMVDLGIGCGAVMISIARERPAWTCLGGDISLPAAKIAKINARAHCVAPLLFNGSWCECLMDHSQNLVLSNPPYVAANDPHLPALGHEPEVALLAGDDGLEHIRLIIGAGSRILREEGYLILEHGFDQGPDVCELFKKAGFVEINNVHDLSGNSRVSYGKLPHRSETR